MEKAARAGYETAQLDYAIWLIDGIGGPKDYEAGFRWMQVAAMRGNVVAQNRMAVLHINAIGTGATRSKRQNGTSFRAVPASMIGDLMTSTRG
jgi:TPR repeat protein